MEKLREILGALGLKFKFEAALVDKCEEYEQRIYALEENRKMKDSAIQSLERRYSELLMIVKSAQADARRADTKR